MRSSLYKLARYDKLFSLSKLQEMTKKYVVCPYYHLVSDAYQPFVSPLYKVKTIDEFQRDLDWLQDNFKPIKWTEIDECENNQTPAFCLSFDDGLREVYDVIFPILKQRNIPALCFINSDFIGNNDMFYRYKAAYLLGVAKNSGYSQLIPKINSITFETKDMLNQLALCLKIDFDKVMSDYKPYMDLYQLNELKKHGWDFGSHSKNHPHYDKISLKEQLIQTSESDAFLLKNNISDSNLFAFPFGQENLSKERIIQETNTHNAVFGTANLRRDIPNFYNRIWMENTNSSAKDIIKGEYFREYIHQQIDDK